MIGQIVRHGRTKKDVKNLHAHLMKGSGTRFEVLNSAAPDLQETMNDMITARGGSRADSAFLHISLSPSRDMTDDELRKTAEIVMKHFNADEHQAVLVIHEKDRANDSGNRHAHLVLGRVGPDGDVLLSGFDKIKLETAVRIAEFELGEPSVLGRHHKSAIKWLQANGRDDVAQYMIAAHSNNPTKPTSSASPAVRQKIERTTGKDLSAISNDVRSAWEKSDNGQSFAAALTSVGLSVKSGKKDGVFVIENDGQEIGALDRLLKEKRAAVRHKMGDFQNDSTAKPTSQAINSSRHIQRNAGEPTRNQTVVSASGPASDSRKNGKWPDRADTGSSERDLVEPKTPHDSDRGHREKRRNIDEKATLIKLDKVRLSAGSAIAMQEFKTLNFGKPVSQFSLNSAIKNIESYKKGWHWIQEYKDDLMQKIKDFQNRLTAKIPVPKPKPAPKLNKVAPVHKQEPDFEPEYSGPRFG